MTIRVISAIVMILVFIPFLLIGNLPFSIFMSLLALCGLYELLKVRESKKKFPLLLKIFAYIIVFIFAMYNSDSAVLKYNVDYRVVAAIIFLFTTPMVFINDTQKYNLNDALFLIGSILFIGLSFNLMITTRGFDLYYILYLFLITTITDTFALVTGMLVGKHKLCPKISPKKTIEGLVGGVIMGTFVSSLFYYTVISSTISLVGLVLITLILTLVGQLGDLVFSSIKRYYDVKDFSNIIPGHGGILDRFDSLIFVTLAFIIFKGIL